MSVAPITSPQSIKSASSLARRFSWLRAREQVIRAVLFLCGALSLLTTAGIIIVLFTEAIYSFGGTAFF